MSGAAFDWDEFLDLAEELVQRRGNPGAERTAVSRAYYAACHVARAYVADRGATLTLTGDDHRLVWNWFLGDGAPRRLQWIGGAGRRLRQARRRVDYGAAPSPNLSADFCMPSDGS